jgi:hypothetical protein
MTPLPHADFDQKKHGSYDLTVSTYHCKIVAAPRRNAPTQSVREGKVNCRRCIYPLNGLTSSYKEVTIWIF